MAPAPLSYVSQLSHDGHSWDHGRLCQSLITTSPPPSETASALLCRSGGGLPPRPLRRSWTRFVSDIVLVLMTMPFVALVVLVLRVHGQEVDTWFWTTAQFKNIALITTTLFPIVFSFVVGQMLSQAARWRLESGTQLGYLEQLMGSKTVFSTFSTHFSLRALNILGVALVSLWLLSPLGTQSALRLLEVTNRESSMRAELTYFDTAGEPVFSSWEGSSPEVRSNTSRLRSMYLASLLSVDTIKVGPGDLWGNVKIPYLPYDLSEADTDWVDVSSKGPAQYSALVGIPAVRPSKPMSSRTFAWESTYVDLWCGGISASENATEDLDFTRMDGSLPSNDTYSANSSNSSLGMPSQVPNGTFSTRYQAWTSGAWLLAQDTFVDKIWYPDSTSVDWSQVNTRKGYFTPSIFANESTIETRQSVLLFQAYISNVVYAYCKVSQVYVESNITCIEGKTCAVVAQRRSPKPQANSNITQLSWPQTMKQVVDLLSSGLGGDSASDPAMHYLAGENATGITVPKGIPRIDVVSSEMFSRRLGQLINTYLMLGKAYTAILAPSADSEAAFRYKLSTTATGKNLAPVYSVSALWLSIFAISIFALTSAAFANLVLNHLSVTPRVLGSVSLAIRDSKYISVPVGAGTKDGLELSRELKQTEIRYGVVERTDDGIDVLGTAAKEGADKARKLGLYL